MKKLLIALFATLCATNVSAVPVNINSADATTISESLSGIGQKKAEAIVKYRTETGPFKTVEDLANVAGIGEKTVQRIKSDIQLSDSEAAAPKKTAKADKKQ
ncbi:helix-hairpin-helix domain-containing protein [Methylobacter sp. BBA5.1]|uniref:ComEA family DNA-binding protein n=1 Tax=Methylobacter sp. BBA5.1 TaxID=1495064 RepID=UPI0005600CCE|nr:helix-hairpin-helix domain-containing protein [Methylobacter sp. BBA5.1]